MELAAVILAVSVVLTFAAWRRYLWAAEQSDKESYDRCPYSLTDSFGRNQFLKVPHQEGIRWLPEVFSRSAKKYPNLTALQVPHSGESLTFAELDAAADSLAAAVAPFLTGPDQVVAVAMPQDSSHIVVAHIAVLRSGGTLVVLDTSLPETLLMHMLDDARPVLVLTRGEEHFRDLPTLDVLKLPPQAAKARPPAWLDDPTQRLATIFYTSGTTGMPKGVECPHAGYVNLALSYADYFDFVPGMDATSLTSSLGYDGSISELYSAWVSGCAVVMLTKEQIRSGPDLIPVLRDAEVTALFCPPVLLSTLTPTPEFDLPYPVCRYIVPAGEAFPPALVEPWTRARRQIINTYGPTEASTDTSRQSLRPGEPVTIGSPFANVTYAILEPDQLRPLPHGEVGELCIGGVHLARGYRNLPEQTAEKFIQHPKFGRLYRTGDKCWIDIRSQRVHFLGRIDAQLKVRGHRVEAQAVEDALQAQFDEIEAAVLDYQNETLIAFVLAPSVRTKRHRDVVPAPAPWAARVIATIAEKFPEPAVPTCIFLVDRFQLQPVSGKIDRRSLPNVSRLLASPGDRVSAVGARPLRRGMEEQRAAPADVPAGSEEVLEICRAVFELPLGWDDRFAQSGGHSIVIARLAQRLQAAGWQLSVRALLSDTDTPRKVASRPRRAQQVTVSPAPAASVDRFEGRDEASAAVLSIAHFTVLQVLFSSLLLAPGFLTLLVFLNYVEIGTFFTTATLAEFVIVGLALYGLGLIMPFVALLWVMIIRLLLFGHTRRSGVTAGIYPKWSRMHLRVWCLGRLDSSVLLPLGAMFRSAPLKAFALRLLGAKVGRNLQCANDAQVSGPFDLISIGDDVVIQTGAYVQVTRWSEQNLHIGPIRLESGCKIGMRAAVAGDARVGAGSWITPFTPILADTGPNELWEGSPARRSGNCARLNRPAAACKTTRPLWVLETGNILFQVAVFVALGVLPAAAIAWFTRDFAAQPDLEGPSNYFGTAPLGDVVWHLFLYALVTSWVTLVVTSVLTALFIRLTAAPLGLHLTSGFKGGLLLLRVGKLNALQALWTWTITGQYLRALAGLRFTRLGASECDILFNLVPEAATADARVFWSNGSFTNMLDYGAEHLVLRHLDMPRNYFSGNNSVAEHGQLPTNFILGVSTPCSEIDFRRQMRSRLGEPITVAGNPPVMFASTALGADGAARRLPDFPLFFARVMLNDVFSIGMLRATELLLFAIIFTSLLRAGTGAIIAGILASIVTETSLILLSAGVKRALVGREWGSEHSTPFWSWRHFAYFFAQDCFFAWCQSPLAFSGGTVLANPILRAMGCRIGRRTIVIEPMQCSDWNAVSFGADCVVAGFLQFHTFENMILKVKRTTIGDGCTVAFGATIMGGAQIESGSTLEPLSMVLKEMRLPADTYVGSPAESAQSAAIASAPCAGSKAMG